VNVTANVNAVAVFGLANQSVFTFTPTGPNSATLDFGTIGSPSLLSASLKLSNNAVAPSDSLAGNYNTTGLAGTPFSLAGASGFDLSAAASQIYAVQFNPLATGGFSGTFAISSASHNAFQSDLDLGIYTVTVYGQVGGGSGGSVPDSPIGFLGALTLLGTLALGHWHRRKQPGNVASK